MLLRQWWWWFAVAFGGHLTVVSVGRLKCSIICVYRSLGGGEAGDCGGGLWRSLVRSDGRGRLLWFDFRVAQVSAGKPSPNHFNRDTARHTSKIRPHVQYRLFIVRPTGHRPLPPDDETALYAILYRFCYRLIAIDTQHSKHQRNHR